ncbi:MAG: hypothetical protein AAFR70_15750, partial [Pseudomonadota bacterium]
QAVHLCSAAPAGAHSRRAQVRVVAVAVSTRAPAPRSGQGSVAVGDRRAVASSDSLADLAARSPAAEFAVVAEAPAVMVALRVEHSAAQGPGPATPDQHLTLDAPAHSLRWAPQTH